MPPDIAQAARQTLPIKMLHNGEVAASKYMVHAYIHTCALGNFSKAVQKPGAEKWLASMTRTEGKKGRLPVHG
jgi:hypothetical protein